MASSSIHNLVHSKDTMHIATRPKITTLPTKNLFSSMPMRHTRSAKLSRSSPTRPALRAVAAGRPNAAREPLNELEESPIKIAIIGFGNFGQFIAGGIKRQGHIVLATSRSDYSEYCNQHGIQFFQSMDAICEEQPDVVLVCSSILSTESVLRAVPLHKLKPDTIFADVLSVKQFPRNLLLEVLPSGFGIVCTHPMFGPESGKHGWNELPFVYDKVRVSNDGMQARRCAQFLSIFEREGCRMVEMSCEEHDRHAAGSQFITHTIGRILSHLELESTPINTRGYETLLKLTENTISDSFDLYYGLFMYNVNASEQIENLDRAFEIVKQKLFGRLHDILRKQIVERVPMQGVPARGRETNISNYFLADAGKITTLSHFASPAQDESRADEATLSS
ncbi:arogenate dehydrogenase 2, chloroplastic-like [Typha angustifolia]|uniref:arogenate dehydrogenase 2, chloroplastic-like n=1 Tax=Typha angustifolia TaxID=59011 RepID=UPI003C2B7EAF